MDKTFEVEVVRLSRGGVMHATAKISSRPDGVSLIVTDGLISTLAFFLPSEAVTIGEQLIAAGKADEV
ncbi:hypothetical protein PQS91_10435 [Stenotrophomonas geniculata]|uniref:hypothetical protein n=1 Tax=Stenotrophomonas geniculata TaxID=86188 RepID=UPI00234F0CEF|nr:hypothetical protein [Stenotrophomonas geniculata]MDC7800264.1 hypothetical protein [Stenotrophomonas geniculata]